MSDAPNFHSDHEVHWTTDTHHLPPDQPATRPLIALDSPTNPVVAAERLAQAERPKGEGKEIPPESSRPEVSNAAREGNDDRDGKHGDSGPSASSGNGRGGKHNGGDGHEHIGDRSGDDEDGERNRLSRRELQDIIRRAQPELPDEAESILARLEAQEPLDPLPFDRQLLAFPEQAKHLLDRAEAPAQREAKIPQGLRQAYEQRSADIQRLWELVHPQSYALMGKYGLTLRLTKTLLYSEFNVHLRVNDVDISFVPNHFNKQGVYYRKVNGQKLLLVEASCPPAQVIAYSLEMLHLLERYAHAIKTGLVSDLTIPSPLERHRRMQIIMEINHALRTPVHLNPYQRRYQEAYDQAILQECSSKAFDHQTLTPADYNVLREIGRQAGQNALLEIVDPSSPEKQLYMPRWLERLPDDMMHAKRAGLDITPIEIDSSVFREFIEKWATNYFQGNPKSQTQRQMWIWALTENGLWAMPRAVYSPPSEGRKPIVTGTNHIMASQGEPAKAAGELMLEVRLSSEPGEDGMEVSVKEVNNNTGHLTVLNLRSEVRELLLQALRENKIHTENIVFSTFTRDPDHEGQILTKLFDRIWWQQAIERYRTQFYVMA